MEMFLVYGALLAGALVVLAMLFGRRSKDHTLDL
jgi:hypothetical protein